MTLLGDGCHEPSTNIPSLLLEKVPFMAILKRVGQLKNSRRQRLTMATKYFEWSSEVEWGILHTFKAYLQQPSEIQGCEKKTLDIATPCHVTPNTQRHPGDNCGDLRDFILLRWGLMQSSNTLTVPLKSMFEVWASIKVSQVPIWGSHLGSQCSWRESDVSIGKFIPFLDKCLK